MRRVAALIAVVFLLAVLGMAQSSSVTVTATGDCNNDLAAVNGAVQAAGPGTEILLAGTFDFTCLSRAVAVAVGQPGIFISGVPGETTINGPGWDFSNFAFRVNAANVTVRNLAINNFWRGVQSVGIDGLAVTGSRFTNTLRSITLSLVGHARITDNYIEVPRPPEGTTAIGIYAPNQCNELLVADNVVIGPGATLSINSLDDITVLTTASVHTAGIWQIDGQPRPVRGRISGNRVSNVDLAIQSSSDDALVSRNVAFGSPLGMAIADDSYEPTSSVRNNIVILNVATGGGVGLSVQSGRDNVITFNDFSNNSFTGLLFYAQVAEAMTSIDNFFSQNQGSVKGVPGNQGTSFKMLLPPVD